jgi:hypothetical protein
MWGWAQETRAWSLGKPPRPGSPGAAANLDVIYRSTTRMDPNEALDRNVDNPIRPVLN